MESFSLAFTAGAFGGLANGLAVWFFGISGINKSLGVDIAPKLTPALIYSKVAWGGIWGLMFLIGFSETSLLCKAVAISIAPTLVQLFYVFPKAEKGTAGLKLGKLTPVMVVFFNLVWAIATAVWIRFS